MTHSKGKQSRREKRAYRTIKKIIGDAEFEKWLKSTSHAEDLKKLNGDPGEAEVEKRRPYD